MRQLLALPARCAVSASHKASRSMNSSTHLPGAEPADSRVQCKCFRSGGAGPGTRRGNVDHARRPARCSW
eukprot:3821185-Rhodomonas_salina.3